MTFSNSLFTGITKNSFFRVRFRGTVKETFHLAKEITGTRTVTPPSIPLNVTLSFYQSCFVSSIIPGVNRRDLRAFMRLSAR